jgi:hypothetical protein
VPDVRVLLVTRGHPFEREPFLAMWDDLAAAGIATEHVEHPEAAERLTPSTLGGIDVVVFYDMPGLRFTRADPPVELVDPPTLLRDGLPALAAAGTGLVVLHHAIAGWPTWPWWTELVGSRFLYQPGNVGGIDLPDSGYLLDVEHEVEVLADDHPVCAGLPARFTLRDELYLVQPPIVPVTALLRTTHPMVDGEFYSADAAVRGRRNDREGWSHPPGTDLVGWAREREPGRASRLVYLQPGDGPSSYADTHVRRLITNAIHWVRPDPAA